MSCLIRLGKSKISRSFFRNYSVVSCFRHCYLKQQINTEYFKYRNFYTCHLCALWEKNIYFIDMIYRHSFLVRGSIYCLPNHSIANDYAVCDPDLKEFNNAYDVIRKAILYTNDKALLDAVNWNSEVLDYNVQGGKQIRGVTVLKAFKILSDKLSSDKVLEACLLGWCVELLQGFFLVSDDIMDNSTTRRGKPCWYRKPTVGLIAINDALLLEHSIYKILEMYFKDHGKYINFLHEFLQTTRKTVYGQCLDMLNVPPNEKPRFENFNLTKYEAIVEYKTSQYTFCLPVHLAMHLAGNFSEKEFELSGDICSKLGLLFQIQDDHLDTFGDPEITGKVGTDISDGKCTWFSASFFECAPEHMRKAMIENYGVNTKDSVLKIMKMYEELHLEQKFFKCQQSLTDEINFMIENLSKVSLQTLFYSLLKKLHHRKK